ncbi:MAG: ADP-ribosylation factor-like protein [Candidatus Helarchaeota archaeon]
MSSFKIILAGLDNSGKTSILLALKDKFSFINPPPTLGVERDTIEVLGFPIIRWDLGGQENFRSTYLAKPRSFIETDLMFYVVDIQNRSRLGEAVEYYEEILKMFRKLGENPKIILCFHKFDPDLKEDERILSNLEVAKQVFRRKTQGFDFLMFETTIFERWTLTVAFSEAILKLSTKSSILDKQLEQFANHLNSETVWLLDENALILGQFYKTRESYEICQITAPHLATMADKIIKYGTTFEIFQVKIGNGGWVFFRDLEIEKKRFYLILYNEKAESLQLIDQLLPSFVDNISVIIESFFID